MSESTQNLGASISQRVAMTGAGGFLGWHTRVALLEAGTRTVPVRSGEAFDSERATQALENSSRLIHIAGVNRAPDQDVMELNTRFARQIADALRICDNPPPFVVYANSIQAGNGSVYGDAKARACEILAETALDLGLDFVDVRLPNIFGEDGQPFYNAVTATFCHLLAEGGNPVVEDDKELTLIHAQDAADLLTGRVAPAEQEALSREETVRGLLARLEGFAHAYESGQIPDIADPFARNLFNTYRSYVIHRNIPIRLTLHADARGSFSEIIRTHGGTGQSSFSTTVPGISRGNHFHRRKVERFTVLSGQARISMRRVFSDKVLTFDVDGESPMAVDIPTMWAHSITNTGQTDLYTSFWTNDLFDPSNPDTISEIV